MEDFGGIIWFSGGSGEEIIWFSGGSGEVICHCEQSIKG